MKIESNSTSISIRTENADDQYLLGRIAASARSEVYAVGGGQRETTVEICTALRILAEALRNRSGDVMPTFKPTCRRCSECRDQEHHWLPNSEFGDEDSTSHRHEYACKHCPATAKTCPECDGNGSPFDSEDECEECWGEGVIIRE